MTNYSKKTWTRERLWDTDLNDIEEGIKNNADNIVQYASDLPGNVSTVDEENSIFYDSYNDNLYYYDPSVPDWIKFALSNDMLVNDSITLTGGTGISSLSEISLGGSETINIDTSSTLTWSDLHTFNGKINMGSNLEDDANNVIYNYNDGNLISSMLDKNSITVSGGGGITGAGAISLGSTGTVSLDEDYGATWTSQHSFNSGLDVGSNINSQADSGTTIYDYNANELNGSLINDVNIPTTELTDVYDSLTPSDGTILAWDDTSGYYKKSTHINDGNPHSSSASDPHLLGGSQHDSDSLSDLNSKVSDATLDDQTSSRPPEAHNLAGSKHNSDSLSDLNSKVSDATLDDETSSRPPDAHNLAGNKHNSDSLSDLNSKISDATLDDQTSSRPPDAHSGSHETTGDDTVNMRNLKNSFNTSYSVGMSTDVDYTVTDGGSYVFFETSPYTKATTGGTIRGVIMLVRNDYGGTISQDTTLGTLTLRSHSEYSDGNTTSSSISHTKTIYSDWSDSTYIITRIQDTLNLYGDEWVSLEWNDNGAGGGTNGFHIMRTNMMVSSSYDF